MLSSNQMPSKYFAFSSGKTLLSEALKSVRLLAVGLLQFSIMTACWLSEQSLQLYIKVKSSSLTDLKQGEKCEREDKFKTEEKFDVLSFHILKCSKHTHICLRHRILDLI